MQCSLHLTVLWENFVFNIEYFTGEYSRGLCVALSEMKGFVTKSKGNAVHSIPLDNRWD